MAGTGSAELVSLEGLRGPSNAAVLCRAHVISLFASARVFVAWMMNQVEVCFRKEILRGGGEAGGKGPGALLAPVLFELELARCMVAGP